MTRDVLLALLRRDPDALIDWMLHLDDELAALRQHHVDLARAMRQADQARREFNLGARPVVVN